ncbi:TetR/AcrR family transcriptional regulator [Aurantiacibacter xanthus]|uniref:TetR/AcrR family transcriptional regulator n=1 Tax=Aurantiacibacter xanthus TaxID=1784712 RepID=UPI00174E84C8|nr:TetR family transcriptional regulator [Aurantiacibacter xanthus]
MKRQTKKAQADQKSETGAAGPDSRQRLLKAAYEEFSANGFSGARIERITAAADVNVRMIYHHFGNKLGLLEAVLSEIFLSRQEQMGTLPERIDDFLLFLFDGYASDRHRVRLLEWEALEATAVGADRPPSRDVTDVEGRRAALQRRVDTIREAQERGEASSEIEPEVLYLILVALAIYPMSFPQSVSIALNEDPESEEFQARYRKALKKVGRLLLQPTRDE